MLSNPMSPDQLVIFSLPSCNKLGLAVKWLCEINKYYNTNLYSERSQLYHWSMLIKNWFWTPTPTVRILWRISNFWRPNKTGVDVVLTQLKGWGDSRAIKIPCSWFHEICRNQKLLGMFRISVLQPTLAEDDLIFKILLSFINWSGESLTIMGVTSKSTSWDHPTTYRTL